MTYQAIICPHCGMNSFFINVSEDGHTQVICRCCSKTVSCSPVIMMHHFKPDRRDVALNGNLEPEGEAFREELESLLDKYQVVSVLLDTDNLHVQIDPVVLPPNIKTILSRWGSVYVEETLILKIENKKKRRIK